ncbi:MAG: hypothetical protein ACJAY8_001175 [Sphingobacteriales bacterium]|jgi:hypothetical protein
MRFFIFLIFSLSLFSCSRFEDNPAFSFRSINNRISGDWELKEMDFQDNMESLSGTLYRKEELHEFVSNGMISRKKDSWLGIGGNPPRLRESNGTHSFSRILTIKKNGDFTNTEVENRQTIMFSSIWYWSDIPTLNLPSRAAAFLGPNYAYTVDRLTKKDLWLNVDYESKVKTDSSFRTQIIQGYLKFQKIKK